VPGEIEAVVFDWDGTLVDSKRALVASFQETTTELLGAPFPVEEEDIERLVQSAARRHSKRSPPVTVISTSGSRRSSTATLYVGDGPTTSAPPAAPARSPSPSPSASTLTRPGPRTPTTWSTNSPRWSSLPVTAPAEGLA
jgi:hypothetical protein